MNFKWIKICTDIFEDEKIVLIKKLPKSDSVIIMWFRLLCLAGKQNNNGVFMLKEGIPYTTQMLSVVFSETKRKVQYALDILEKYGLISITDSVISITNWSRYQSFEKSEDRKAYQREYQRNYRKKQKASSAGADSEKEYSFDINEYKSLVNSSFT